MPVAYRPEGYHTVTPYLVVHDAAALIDFAVNVAGATEKLRMPGEGGRIGHAEIQLGDSVIMLADIPRDGQETLGMLHVYVEDVDDIHKRAVAAGATSTREPRTEFYGDRGASVTDDNGVKWYFATHVEDVSDEELIQRAKTQPQEAADA